MEFRVRTDRQGAFQVESEQSSPFPLRMRIAARMMRPDGVRAVGDLQLNDDDPQPFDLVGGAAAHAFPTPFSIRMGRNSGRITGRTDPPTPDVELVFDVDRA